ncbi:MAG: hypothetical protein FWD57_02780 [Polyangiaceae bacterium]|nr:hypothetical protein [Polyangiaceae bacterium]
MASSGTCPHCDFALLLGALGVAFFDLSGVFLGVARDTGALRDGTAVVDDVADVDDGQLTNHRLCDCDYELGFLSQSW